MKAGLGAAFHFRLSFVVDELPSTALDSAERGAGTMIAEALGPEAAPILSYHLVQWRNDIIEGVSLHHRPGAGRAVEELTEIVDGFRALALLTDNDINPEPVQRVFVVEIRSAAASAVSCKLRQARPGV